jgi:hypothetical protein
MVALTDLEARLKHDPQARREFFADPAGVLRRAGVPLPASRENALRQTLAKHQAPPPDVLGARLMPVIIDS